jgi:ABC-type Zn uptake system ZnuABC Zn-binding protein ZnuA
MTATEEASAEGDDHEHEDEHGSERLGMLYTLECGGHDGEHEGEEADHDEDEGDEHGHEEGGCDPHVWTNPHNVIYWTFMIRDTLSALDPANAETYAANAAAYAETLDAFTHDFLKPMLESVPEAQRILITNHETLGYLAAMAEYEVVAVVIPGGGTAAEPSAADIANLIDLVRDEGVPAIFAENTVSTNIAEQVAAESGASFHVLLSDSLSGADGSGTTYLEYMRYNVTTIVQALGGGM